MVMTKYEETGVSITTTLRYEQEDFVQMLAATPPTIVTNSLSPQRQRAYTRSARIVIMRRKGSPGFVDGFKNGGTEN